MLVELKDVEVFVEPEKIFTQALQEGDISIKKVIELCEYEEGEESILDEIDNDRIRDYCKKYDLNIDLDSYSQVINVVDDFTHQERALLLWKLLKG